ncbi:hypothetical protein IV498_00520 [Paenarthrobacter sp. Z7-10]|uniref:hypothetical protein n=1 Tax=Paenarthrobacter sp. Z7-10 TaxID=2787635 RepID=UPI0022A9E7B7|nr:hypothetical protein [Paenarthrobacter sp. Z7-10]MCZ2401706.1 hypothetical protein [Paenarthrobacter sp. Z7-10]
MTAFDEHIQLSKVRLLARLEGQSLFVAPQGSDGVCLLRVGATGALLRSDCSKLDAFAAGGLQIKGDHGVPAVWLVPLGWKSDTEAASGWTMVAENLFAKKP